MGEYTISKEAELKSALQEVMDWIRNWSPPFIEDAAWTGTEQRVWAALESENDD
jgi:hypothetical protein